MLQLHCFLQLPINSIFSLSVVYGIMGWGLFVCMYTVRHKKRSP